MLMPYWIKRTEGLQGGLVLWRGGIGTVVPARAWVVTVWLPLGKVVYVDSWGRGGGATAGVIFSAY